MTQNDISFYAAKKSAQDARLKRKEAKRHNLEQERLQSESNVASMLGSEARMVSANAAQQTANTNQKKYELDWEREYGAQYGTDMDQVISDRSYAYLDNNPELDVIVPVYTTSSGRNYVNYPQSFRNTVYSGRRTLAEIEKAKADKVKTIFDTAKSGGQTVEIIEDFITGGK